jgi:hypothetical protein
MDQPEAEQAADKPGALLSTSAEETSDRSGSLGLMEGTKRLALA